MHKIRNTLCCFKPPIFTNLFSKYLFFCYKCNKLQKQKSHTHTHTHTHTQWNKVTLPPDASELSNLTPQLIGNMTAAAYWTITPTINLDIKNTDNIIIFSVVFFCVCVFFIFFSFYRKYYCCTHIIQSKTKKKHTKKNQNQKKNKIKNKNKIK